MQAPSGVDNWVLQRLAARRGVLVEPGDIHFLGADRPAEYFRLGFGAIEETQIERGIAADSACTPSREERTLQYWRHKWKGREQTFTEVVEARDPHGFRTYRLVSVKDNIAVIYDESRDRVIKVVKYGSR